MPVSRLIDSGFDEVKGQLFRTKSFEFAIFFSAFWRTEFTPVEKGRNIIPAILAFQANQLPLEMFKTVVFFGFFCVVPTVSRANEISGYPAYTFKALSACSVADIDKIPVASLDVDTFDGQRSAFSYVSEIISRLCASGVVNPDESNFHAVNNVEYVRKHENHQKRATGSPLL